MPMSDYVRMLRAKVGNTLLEIPTVSVLVFDDRQRVLLVKHVEGEVWSTPGGAVEPRETPANAAVREMWEETGLCVELVRVLGVYGGPEFVVTYSNGDAASFVMTVFEARPTGGEMRPDGRETLDVAYFAETELAGLHTQPWVAGVLRNAFADRHRLYWDRPTWSPPSG